MRTGTTTRSRIRIANSNRRAVNGAVRCTTGCVAAGAIFGTKFGWERANWFTPVDGPSAEIADVRALERV